MISIKKEFKFEAAHRLPLHGGACANIHGHSYKLVVEVSGEPEKVGPATDMVTDFGTLTNVVHDIINEGMIQGRQTVPLDHSIMLWKDDPLLEVLKTAIEKKDIPGQRLAIFTNQPTAEYMAEMLANFIQSGLEEATPQDIKVTRVEVWETAKSYAIWESDYE
jgi:6-pyruvoyltetrahydropterin/6-carboxytetrahydropterin synthase